MPLLLQERPLDENVADYFSQVLRNDPDAARALADARPDSHRLFAGVFNQRPVAMLLLAQSDDALAIEQVVVHPATRNRGVATELLRQAEQRVSALRWPGELERLARKAGLA